MGFIACLVLVVPVLTEEYKEDNSSSTGLIVAGHFSISYHPVQRSPSGFTEKAGYLFFSNSPL
jgi:hypothetical protein